MTITELRKCRGRLYRLVLDGEPAVTVDVRTFEESPYRVGSSLSVEELEALLDESARRRAREKAVDLLSRRDHSRRGLEESCGGKPGRRSPPRPPSRWKNGGISTTSGMPAAWRRI